MSKIPILLALLLIAAKSPLIVNIDNPTLRKINTAIPHFTASGIDGKKIARYSQQRLRKILGFSRLFNITGGRVYQKRSVTNSSLKKMGVELLITGICRQKGKTVSLQLTTTDVRRKTSVITKTYSAVTLANVDQSLRNYGDLILKKFTKKPGIFFSKIAFVGKKSKKDFKQIYTIDFDGSNLKQITNTPAHHLSPSWSPDNRYLVYTSFEDGNPDLFIYDRLQKKHSKISGRSGVNSGGQFAHTGNIVAFTGSQRGDTDIYITDTRGLYRHRLIKGFGLDVDPTFSPNGKWLAFVSGRYGNPHIFRATLSWAHNRLQVIEDKRLTYAGWYNANPSWSPDSKKIAFAGYDRDIDRFDIFLMNADGSNFERMTLNKGDNESPSWSPNGMLLVFFSTRTKYSRKGPAKLYIMNRDGSEQKLLATKLYEAQTPRWSNNVSER